MSSSARQALGNAESTIEVSDLRDQVRNLGDDLKELARLTKSALGQKVHAAKGSAASVYDRSRDKAVEYRDHIVDAARENPLKSILIAAAVGAVLGLVFGRR